MGCSLLKTDNQFSLLAIQCTQHTVCLVTRVPDAVGNSEACRCQGWMDGEGGDDGGSNE